MLASRRTEIAVGVLFFVATASYLAGSELIASELGAPDYLENLNSGRIHTGVLLEFINAAAVVGIGALLFPILRKYREGMALVYAGARLVESALLLVSALGPLLLVPLSREYGQAMADVADIQLLGTLAREGYDLAFQLAMIVLGTASVLLCYILYEARLVPRVLPVLGVVGYVALLTSGWLEVFGYDTGTVLFVPGAIFELLFPLWLIVKGMQDSAGPGATE